MMSSTNKHPHGSPLRSQSTGVCIIHLQDDFIIILLRGITMLLDNVLGLIDYRIKSASLSPGL